MESVKKAAPEALLTSAFQRLKKDNSTVSLRSLAQRMEISPSYLSKIMRGLKPVSPTLIPKLQKAFHLDVLETKTLQRLTLESIESKNLTPTTGIKSLDIKASNLNTYKGLTKEDFILLEKWFYIPLLNLLTIKGFKNDRSWIAKKLGLTVSEIDAALKTLIRFGYVQESDGTLTVTSLKARFPTDKSHESIRNYHQMMIKKASQELSQKTDEASFNQRLINSISFAGDSKKAKQAQAILNQALFEVAELMSDENPDHVFQINLQFFKVSK